MPDRRALMAALARFRTPDELRSIMEIVITIVPLILRRLRTVIRSPCRDSLSRQAMMGRLKHEQERFFYEFELDEAVPTGAGPALAADGHWPCKGPVRPPS
jgi:hypothetical protein